MRTLVLLILFFGLSMNCIAQSDSLVINLKDGKVEKIALSQIQKIQFENVTAVEEQAGQSIGLDVKGNYPNPFGEQTTIEFDISTLGNVEIVIYDNGGNQIQTLKCENCPAGKNTLLWNCLDKNNNRVQSGVYYYEIRKGSEVQTKKMILVK